MTTGRMGRTGRMKMKAPWNWRLALLLPALVIPLAVSAQEMTAQEMRAQEAKPKSTARSGIRSQRLDPMSQTQGSADQEPGDQILLYRFRLDAESAASQLIVANSTDGDGTIALFAQGADGAIAKEIKRTIDPGAVFAISPAEAGWSSSNVVSVKASRRLLLSLQLPGEPKPTEIVPDASVAVYDVFGFERQSELVPSGKKRGLSLVYSDRRFSRELAPETSPQQGASELLQTSGSAPARGLFVLQSNR